MKRDEQPDVKVLGIDPALSTTGYGVIRSNVGKIQLIDAGVIRVPRDKELAARLKELYEGCHGDSGRA